MNRYNPSFEIRSAAVIVDRYPGENAPAYPGEVVLTLDDDTKAQFKLWPHENTRPILAVAVEADFASDTLTFRCPSGYHAAAGKWLLVPVTEYHDPIPDKPRVSLWSRVFGA